MEKNDENNENLNKIILMENENEYFQNQNR